MRQVQAMVLTLFFLASVEFTLRIFKIGPYYGYPKGMFQQDELLDYRLTPNFKGKFVRHEFTVEVSTNSLGLRDVEYGAKGEKDFRILALGDSFTWAAYGTSLQETFVKILEKKLNLSSANLRYQVINAGVPGYSTDQELLYLINRGLHLQPDLVMLNFHVGNDFADNMVKAELTVKNGFLVPVKSVDSYDEIRQFLARNLYLYSFVEKICLKLFPGFIEEHIRGRLRKEDHLAQLFVTPPSTSINQQSQRTWELLSQLKRYIDSHKMRLLIVLIPIDIQVDEERWRAFVKKNYHRGETINRRQPQEIIKRWAEENQVVSIDVLPELQHQSSDWDFYWRLNPHFNAKGNEVVASVIYEALRAREDLLTVEKSSTFP